MQPFRTLRGIAVPMLIPNIDTGLLAPVAWGRDHPDDLGRGMMMDWRIAADGSERADFVLNQPRYRGASILLAGENFGCGSSRETAVWALLQFGIRCVIAPGFGEIFRDNCYQNGLLPIALPDGDVAALAAWVAAAAQPELEIDLEHCRIVADTELTLDFAIPADRRAALRDGLDETLVIAGMRADIAAFRTRDRLARPWVYAAPQGLHGAAAPVTP